MINNINNRYLIIETTKDVFVAYETIDCSIVFSIKFAYFMLYFMEFLTKFYYIMGLHLIV